MTEITNKEQVIEFIKDAEKPICDSCELESIKCPMQKAKDEFGANVMFCKFYK